MPSITEAVVSDGAKNAHKLVVRNVLFATDFSPASNRALPYAAAICRRFKSTLHVAHVLYDASIMMMTGGADYVTLGTLYEEAEREARKNLENVVRPLEDIPHSTYLRSGEVWPHLAEILKANAIDLIVLGTHGRSGLGKLLLGSVAEDILRRATCPVLTVGPFVSGRDKLPEPSGAREIVPVELDLRHILLAINFDPHAPEVVRIAVGLAEEFCSHLTVLHVIENHSELATSPRPMEAGSRLVRELIPPDAALPYPPETRLEFGLGRERILKIAHDLDSDLIVLGARSHAEVGSSHLPWSTAHHVIAEAHCPVLTLKK